jgi:pimeloyl-ACP methyl ester carboxylesterase
VFHLDEGAGDPPVVLLHAFPLSSAMWQHQVAHLRSRHRVIAPDLRGFGRSEVPDRRDRYSVDGWADDVAGLIGQLGLGRVVLGGLSMGGYVCFAFVRRHAEKLAGLILADTRAGPDAEAVRDRRADQQRLLEQATNPSELGDRLLGPLVGPTSTRRGQTLAVAATLLSGNRAPGVIGALEAMKNRPDSSSDLSGITVPTLVIVGDQDQPSPPEVAEEMAGAIPGGRVVVIPDAGHLSNIENPTAFNQALDDFLGQF